MVTMLALGTDGIAIDATLVSNLENNKICFKHKL